MQIILNGSPFETGDGVTVSGLLLQLERVAGRVAVEVNLTVIRKGAYDTHRLGEGDQVEIVSFVGGGSL